MIRMLLATLLVLPLASCGRAELTSAAAINADREAYMDEVVRLEGLHVKSDSNMRLVTTAPINFFVLEDDSGKIRVWYNTSRRRCPPRTGARLTVEGKVVDSNNNLGHIFVAKSIAVEDGPALADNEIRMCQLSIDEAQIEAMQGREALLAYWREQGKPDRVLIYD